MRFTFAYIDHDQQVHSRFLGPSLENLKGDSTKLRDDLKWEPEYTFESMLDEMITYWIDYYEATKPNY